MAPVWRMTLALGCLEEGMDLHPCPGNSRIPSSPVDDPTHAALLPPLARVSGRERVRLVGLADSAPRLHGRRPVALPRRSTTTAAGFSPSYVAMTKRRREISGMVSY